MKTGTWLCVLVVFWFVPSQPAGATAPTPAEMREARRWAAAKFEGVTDAKWPDGVLHVLANNDAVIPNARGGKPLLIGDKPYTRGLYCHAVSKVVVRLPGVGQDVFGRRRHRQQRADPSRPRLGRFLRDGGR